MVLRGGVLTAKKYEAQTLTFDTSRAEKCCSKPESNMQLKSVKLNCMFFGERTRKNVAHLIGDRAPIRSVSGNWQQSAKAVAHAWYDCEAQPIWAPTVLCFNSTIPYFVAHHHLSFTGDRVATRSSTLGDTLLLTPHSTPWIHSSSPAARGTGTSDLSFATLNFLREGLDP